MDEKYLEMAGDSERSAINAGVRKSQESKQLRPVGFDGTCTCGEEIPEGRVSLGYYNCAECQAALERRGKFFVK